MSIDVDALGLPPACEQRAGLLAALRRGDPLPPEVGGALADLVQQVAQVASRVESGFYAPTDRLLGVLDVITEKHNDLIAGWTDQEESKDG